MRKYVAATVAGLAVLVAVAVATGGTTVDTDRVTDQSCDAVNPCPDGQSCISLPDHSPRCVEGEENPCTYVDCGFGKQCVVMESYPPQVACMKASWLP